MNIGSTTFNNIKIGSTTINKVYIGSDKVYPDVSFVLDGLSGSTGGFSLRKLSSTYSGDAVEVRRSSDNTTQNIGFINNQLDTASLNTFCSGTDGFVSIWYNQSDASNNLIQTTASNQPKIHDSSTGVELENGKPTITFNGTTSYLKMSNNTYGNIDDLLTTLAVVKTTSGGTQMITAKGYIGEAEHMFYFAQSGGQYRYVIENEIINVTTGSNVVNQQNLFSMYLSTGTNGVKQFNNGSLYYQHTTTQDLIGSLANFPYSVGYNVEKKNWFLQGNIQELITFDNNLISDRTSIEDNINSFYSIY